MSLLTEVIKKLENDQLSNQETQDLKTEMQVLQTAIEKNEQEKQNFQNKLDNAVNNPERRERILQINDGLDEIVYKRQKIMAKRKIAMVFSAFNFLVSMGCTIPLVVLLPQTWVLFASIMLSGVAITALTIAPLFVGHKKETEEWATLREQENALVDERFELIEGKNYQSVLENEGDEIANKKYKNLDRRKRIDVSESNQVVEENFGL